MADKKVYAWAFKDNDDKYLRISIEKPPIDLDIKRPLYSIEEVQYVIENNELPKRPVAWVFWDDGDLYKFVAQGINATVYGWEHEIPVYSADELLAELQKEI